MPEAQLDLFDPLLSYPTLPRRRGLRRRNELLEIMGLAMVVARRHLNDYSCPKSKHTFTQPQLLACLILKTSRSSATAARPSSWKPATACVK